MHVEVPRERAPDGAPTRGGPSQRRARRWRAGRKADNVARMSSDVIILFGGTSSERRVSVASAQNVSRLLDDAALWFWAPSGAVHAVARDELAAHADAFVKDFTPRGAAVFSTLADALSSSDVRGRAFLLALHGGDGENGTVQRLLEARGLAFTGSGSAASARAFDKAQTKALAAAQGVRVAAARVLSPADPPVHEAALRELLATHPRWVLKPLADGSSHGLVHLKSGAQVPEAAALLARLGLTYLAEVFIEGRELTVGVVDAGAGPEALPVSEVRLAANAAFDYEGKYLGKGTEEITPAALTDAERAAAQQLAVTTHRAVGCEGYSRTDMILTSQGPVLLEINTLPGLTRASFIPQQLAAAGKDLTAFLRGQLELARARRAR
jgi:D-alanine-D-alanine ligase